MCLCTEPLGEQRPQRFSGEAVSLRGTGHKAASGFGGAWAGAGDFVSRSLNELQNPTAQPPSLWEDCGACPSAFVLVIKPSQVTRTVVEAQKFFFSV